MGNIMVMAMMLSMCSETASGSILPNMVSTASYIPAIKLLTQLIGTNLGNNIPKDRKKARKDSTCSRHAHVVLCVPRPMSRVHSAKVITHTLYEHNCRCHFPHDPKNCEACLRARMMAKSNTKNEDWEEIQGKDKGFVYSVDYIGPYSPDINGNIYGFCGSRSSSYQFWNSYII